MTEFIMGALSAFVVMVTVIVVIDFRRWSREEEAYRYAQARRRSAMQWLNEEPPNGGWSNERWSA